MFMAIMIFKNNRLFKEYTNADLAIEMFKNHGTRIREYIKIQELVMKS